MPASTKGWKSSTAAWPLVRSLARSPVCPPLSCQQPLTIRLISSPGASSARATSLRMGGGGGASGAGGGASSIFTSCCAAAAGFAGWSEAPPGGGAAAAATVAVPAAVVAIRNERRLEAALQAAGLRARAERRRARGRLAGAAAARQEACIALTRCRTCRDRRDRPH